MYGKSKNKDNLLRKYKFRNENYMKKAKYLKELNSKKRSSTSELNKQNIIEALRNDEAAQQAVQALLSDEKFMDAIFYRMLSEEDVTNLSEEQIDELRKEFTAGVQFELSEV